MKSYRARRLTGTLIVVEPWEFGSAHGAAPMDAALQSVSEGHVLVDLGRTLEFEGTPFRRLVGVPRHEGVSIEDLWQGRPVVVDLVPIEEGRTMLKDPVRAAESWRGWGLIGELRAKRS